MLFSPSSAVHLGECSLDVGLIIIAVEILMWNDVHRPGKSVCSFGGITRWVTQIKRSLAVVPNFVL